MSLLGTSDILLTLTLRGPCFSFLSNAPCSHVDLLGLDTYQVVVTGVDIVQVYWKSTPMSIADLQAAHRAINQSLNGIRNAVLSSTCGTAAATDIRLIPRDLPGKLANLTRDGPGVEITGTDVLRVTDAMLDVASVMKWYGGGDLAEFTKLQDRLEAYLSGGACSHSRCQDLCDAMKAFVNSVPNVSPSYIDTVIIHFAHTLCYAKCPCGP